MDIYFQNKIYVDCKMAFPALYESSAYARINWSDHLQRYQYTTYEVHGKHSFTDGMDVTGKWKMGYQRMHYDAHEWENIPKDKYDKGQYDFRTVALPLFSASEQPISEWSENYSGRMDETRPYKGTKCQVKEGTAMRNAVVCDVNMEAQTYDVDIIGLGTKMSNIPFSIWRPISEPASEQGEKAASNNHCSCGDPSCERFTLQQPEHTVQGSKSCGKSTVDGSYLKGVYKKDGSFNYIDSIPVHPWSIGLMQSDIFGFTMFCGLGFWLNEDSNLWESFDEGEQFEVNGQMQFRFTTEELYQVYQSQLNTQK